MAKLASQRTGCSLIHTEMFDDEPLCAPPSEEATAPHTPEAACSRGRPMRVSAKARAVPKSTKIGATEVDVPDASGIDINLASLRELQRTPGIGTKKADVSPTRALPPLDKKGGYTHIDVIK